jgi:hypothetical protein
MTYSTTELSQKQVLFFQKSAKILLHNFARKHHFPAAADTLQPEIHPHPEQLPLIRSTGMRLLHPDHFSNLKIHAVRTSIG